MIAIGRAALVLLMCGGLLDALEAAPARGEAKQVEVGAAPSGFLGDYSDLKLHPDREDLMLYVKREGVLADYAHFIVARPVIYFHPEARGQGVDPRDLVMLSDDLHEKLVEALRKDDAYAVVDEPGEGVAHLRIAITDVVPVDPKRNVGAKAVGVVAGVGLLVPRVDLGFASIEAELVDSQSGERLLALIAVKKPRRFGGIIKGSKEWGDARAAFKKWAKQFRQRLDEVHDD